MHLQQLRLLAIKLIIKQMPGEKPSQNVFGKMQAAFVASSTLKRNRRYLDIVKINCEEETSQIKRRKPLAASKSIQAKINRSFSNSTAAATERLDKDISRFRSRIKSQERPSTAHSFFLRSTESISPAQIKGVSIGQQLSREQFYKVRSKPVLDQRFFNNFSLQNPDQTHTYDVGRGPQRDFDSTLKHVNDLEYNTQKLYQKYYFKPNTMDCRFHYKKQKEEQRYFFVSGRSEDKPATDLSPDEVKKAAQTVRIQPNIDSFFMNSGRELPCQFQQRTGSALTSHWRGKDEKIERPAVEYTVRNMKERLCEKRKESVSASKRPKFNRNELCDKKFFIVGAHS